MSVTRARRVGESRVAWRRRIHPPKRTALSVATTVHGSARILQGHGSLGDQMKPDELQLLLNKAKAAGVSVSPNDVYVPTIAQESMDPMAIVPQMDPEGHIRRLSKLRGTSYNGAVNVQGPEREPEPDIALGDDIIEEEAYLRVKDNPDLARDPEALRESIVEKHGAST